MNILSEFYKDQGDIENPECSGCSILNMDLPYHRHTDWNDLQEADILFVSDSFKFKNGVSKPFALNEFGLIKKALQGVECNVEYTAASKCPRTRS